MCEDEDEQRCRCEDVQRCRCAVVNVDVKMSRDTGENVDVQR